MKRALIVGTIVAAVIMASLASEAKQPQVYVALPSETETYIEPSIEAVETVETEELIQPSLEDELAVICARYDVELEYLMAIGTVESHLDAGAVNGNNYGMFQINESNLERLYSELGKGDLRDYRYNAECACWLIRYYLDMGIDNYYFLAMCYEGNLGYATPLYGQGIIDDYAWSVMDEYHKLKDEVID